MSALTLPAAPTAAHVLVAVAGYQPGSGRLVPGVAAVVALISVVIGGRALARAGRARVLTAHRDGPDGARGNAPSGAVLAVVTGLVAAGVGGLHAANSAGGLGTGNGLAGAVVALVLGLVGAVVGGLALLRRAGEERRVGSGSAG